MSDCPRIRLLSIDAHPLLREGIAAIVNNQPDMQLVAQAMNGQRGIESFRKDRPDVTLMDLGLPDMSGVDTLLAIRSEFPEARIIILTTFEGDFYVQRALEAGARGYLLKTMPHNELVDAIRQVHAGRKSIATALASRLAEHLADEALTRRESEVLRLVGAGYRNRQVSEMLFISEETVKIHMKHVLDKLGATHRTQAVAIAISRGIIQMG